MLSAIILIHGRYAVPFLMFTTDIASKWRPYGVLRTEAVVQAQCFHQSPNYHKEQLASMINLHATLLVLDSRWRFTTRFVVACQRFRRGGHEHRKPLALNAKGFWSFLFICLQDCRPLEAGAPENPLVESQLFMVESSSSKDYAVKDPLRKPEYIRR